MGPCYPDLDCPRGPHRTGTGGCQGRRLGGPHPASVMRAVQVQNQVSAPQTSGPECVGGACPGAGSWNRPIKAQDYRTPALLWGQEPVPPRITSALISASAPRAAEAFVFLLAALSDEISGLQRPELTCQAQTIRTSYRNTRGVKSSDPNQKTFN